MTRVSLEEIVKRYGSVTAVRGLDLEIVDGEFIVFVGPSGCGKSTLLRMIAGLEPITEGTIRFDGERVNTKTPGARGIALVFQNYALYPHMTVRQNLSFGLENIKLPRDEIDRRVAKASGMLRINEYLDRRPKQLSGGQQQRVAIGRAIVKQPSVFLFDEPLSNLDAALRMDMRAEIAMLHQELKATSIYVTHDQIEAMTLADRIVVMREGLIEQVGRPIEVYEKPASRFVAEFIGAPKINMLDAHYRKNGADGALDLANGQVVPVGLGEQLSDGASVSLGVRPDQLSLDNGLDFGAARVRFVEQLGDETLIYVEHESGSQLVLKQAGVVDKSPGEEVHVRAELGNLHVFREDGARVSDASDAGS